MNMKNRTLIGAFCMIIAFAITFLVAPYVNRIASDTTEVLRLSQDVKQGTQITKEKLETVKVKTDTIPNEVINSQSEIVGKYAASDLYSGDYLNAAKLSGEAGTAEDVFSALDGTKVAVSITIDSFAAGLSGKLRNGDIISILVTDKDKTETIIPGALTYLKVITTTTAGGVDNNKVVKNEDGTYELPSTVTVLVNTTQAKLLAEYENGAVMQVALVYRGNTETANQFLRKQAEFFGG